MHANASLTINPNHNNMALHISERNNVIVLKGNLTNANIKSLRSYLLHLFETKPKVVVDLNKVDCISREIARELYKVKKQAFSYNRVLEYIYNPKSEQPEAQKLLVK